MNILCSAELFGFGPTSSLLAIIQGFRRYSGTRFNFYIINTEVLPPLLPEGDEFHVLQDVHQEDLRTIFAIEPPTRSDGTVGFDMVLTSYDPGAAIYGWYHDIPTVLYEGLFFLWNTHTFKDTLEGDIAFMRECKARGDVEQLFGKYTDMYSKNPHSALFAGHFFADRCYVRKTSRNEAVYQQFPVLRELVYEKGCLHDPALAVVPEADRKHYLVSLSGSLAPVISLEENIAFAEAILDWTVDIARRPHFQGHPWIYVGHPKLIEALSDKPLPEHFTLLPAVSPTEFLDLVRYAKALFTGCGFSAMEEPGYFRVPTFIIPEQNGSHPPSIVELRDWDYPTGFNLTATAHLNDYKEIYGKYGVAPMYRDIMSLLRSPEHAALREDLIARFTDTLADDSARTALVASQYDAIDRMMGGFDGAREIYEDIRDSVLPPGLMA